MILKQVKISKDDKDRLIRLKTKTGIQNWNVLCRWCLCFSLCEPTVPPPESIVSDSNVEMSWQVFGGEYADLYEALLYQRCINDGLGLDKETVAEQFKLHLQRGISYLSATNYIKSIEDLFKKAEEKVVKKNDHLS